MARLAGMSLLLAALLIFPLAKARATGEEAALTTFLRDFFSRDEDDGEPRSVTSAFVDLNGDGEQDAVVRLEGNSWCGTGGCTMLILRRDHGLFQLVSKVPAVSLPIRALTTRSHGWLDIGAWVQGGGILQGYEDRLTYNGTSYLRPRKTSKQLHQGTPLIGRDAKPRLLR